MSDLKTLGSLLRLARDTVANPREGAATVLSYAPPREALYMMFALVIVVSIILGEIVALMLGTEALPDDPAAGLTNSPIIFGILQGVFLVGIAHAIHKIGRAFGGTGEFNETLLLVVWLQFIFIVVQIVQIVLILFAPPLTEMITIVALALFFWLLTNFVAVLHGFKNLGQVFMMIIVSIIAIVFILSIVLAILGIGLPQGPSV